MTILLATIHFVMALGRLMMPGGTRRLVAENVMIKQQLIVMRRTNTNKIRLSSLHRLVFGFLAGLISKKRIEKVCVILSPATVMKFHRALVKRKYRRLFSNKSPRRKKPGPKGPTLEMIRAIVEIKRKNPTYGCPRIADVVNNTFGTDIEKDVVRRILMKHYRPDPKYLLPSWLAFLGHTKDSLWTLDLFRCESATLQTYWVLVILEQNSRKIIGFSVNRGDVNGLSLRRMFNEATAGSGEPRRICHDNDPLFHSWEWQSLMGCLFFGDESRELWSVPYTPVSNPFCERVIGTVRREYLDHVLFWNKIDLEWKLSDYRNFYNTSRVHRSICGQVPAQWAKDITPMRASLENYSWKSQCRGLFNIPIAA